MALYPMAATVTLEGILFGQRCVTRLLYFSAAADDNPTSQGLCETAKETIWDDVLEANLHSNFRLDAIRGSISISSGGTSKPEYILFVNEPGLVTGTECLPPFVTVVIRKFPDNANVVGSIDTNYEFRYGRTSFSGIPEGQQVNGQIASASLASWNAIGEAMETLTLPNGNGGHVMTLGMSRVVTQSPYSAYNVMVAETAASNKIGTQNTRKL